MTRFAMVSMSKIPATTTISLMALEAGKIHLEDRAPDYFSGPADKQEMTIQHLLTHTMAIGHKLLNIPGSTNESIPEYILGLPCAERIGTRVRYSSLGFILLGRILEKIYGKRPVCDSADGRHHLHCEKIRREIIRGSKAAAGKNSCGNQNGFAGKGNDLIFPNR